MRSRILVSLIALLTTFAGAAQTQPYRVPACASEETAPLLDLLAEYKMDAEADLRGFSDIMRYSQEQIADRATWRERLPLCANGIETHNLLLQLGADTVARTALDFAALPAEQNPYRLRLASDRARIEALSASLLERGTAPQPEARLPQACEPEDIARLDALSLDYFALIDQAPPDGSRDAHLDAVDRRLAWREEVLPGLPACAEAIELRLLLSRASADSAANQALAFAGVSPGNSPYRPLETEASAELRNWRERMTAAAQTVSRPERDDLPPCNDAQLAGAWRILAPQRDDMARIAASPLSLTELLAFSEKEIASRAARTGSVPACAEALEAAWRLADALADLALARALTPPSGSVGERAQTTSAAAASALGQIESRVADAPATTIPAGADARACNQADAIAFNVYHWPAFSALTQAAFATETPADLPELARHSANFRDLLLEHLPRCAETLEMGWLMRGAAADFPLMLALESAGAPPPAIPQTDAIIDSMRRLATLVDSLKLKFNIDSMSADDNIYYVTADGFVNLRACGSTECAVIGLAQPGAALRVLDDSGAWYQIELEKGGTAWIAGFLVGRTPSGA